MHRTKKCVILKVAACATNNKRRSRYISADVCVCLCDGVAHGPCIQSSLVMNLLGMLLLLCSRMLDALNHTRDLSAAHRFRGACQAELSAHCARIFAACDRRECSSIKHISAWLLSLSSRRACKIFDNICKWFIVFRVLMPRHRSVAYKFIDFETAIRHWRWHANCENMFDT